MTLYLQLLHTVRLRQVYPFKGLSGNDALQACYP